VRCEGSLSSGLNDALNSLKLIATGKAAAIGRPDENHRVREVAGLDKISEEGIKP